MALLSNRFSGYVTGTTLPVDGGLAMYNWIPQTEGDKNKLQRINDEHLAATAAAVQNFLLQLTAAELENYWSSGGLWEQYPYQGIDPVGIMNKVKELI